MAPIHHSTTSCWMSQAQHHCYVGSLKTKTTNGTIHDLPSFGPWILPAWQCVKPWKAMPFFFKQCVWKMEKSLIKWNPPSGDASVAMPFYGKPTRKCLCRSQRHNAPNNSSATVNTGIWTHGLLECNHQNTTLEKFRAYEITTIYIYIYLPRTWLVVICVYIYLTTYIYV